MTADNSMTKVRADKWLWAARFFKTRSLAKTAIEGGKVHLDGQRIKVSKELCVGDRLSIRQGWDEKEVVVVALSTDRRSAQIAQTLYEETPKSIEKRQREQAARKAAGSMARPDHRPDKYARRQLNRLRRHGISDVES
jgi:ribosome-associated heat shock protein Hsp15